MPERRAVLFDAGNTLLDLDYPYLAALAWRLGAPTTPDAVAAAGARLLRQAGATYGMVPPPADADGVFLGSFTALGRAVGLPARAARTFAEAALAEDKRDPRGLWRLPAPGAAETLAALSARGLLLGVVSNGDGHAEAHLRLAGLSPHLGVVVDSYDVGVEKPDPRIFHCALQALGVPPAAALHVGDLPPVDVAGAQAAGLRALLYDPWDAYADHAGARIHALADVASHLQG